MSDQNDDAKKPEKVTGPSSAEELLTALEARVKLLEGRLDNPPPRDEAVGAEGAKNPEHVAARPSAQEELTALEDRIRLREGKPNNQPTKFRTFCAVVGTIVNSGLFFMALGGLLLFLAQKYMATNHAGITFVLVVLGVALILYGTGTQGAGQFNSSAGYNVVIAGGAGLVAFAVAYGMIRYSPYMRNAFQPERKFVRVYVEGGDGLTDITRYAATFDIDGSPVPAAPAGNRAVEVYIPYLPYEATLTPPPESSNSREDASLRPIIGDLGMCNTEENREAARHLNHRAPAKTITAHFQRVQEKIDSTRPETKEFLVRLDQHIFRSNDGGVDFPEYPVRFCVSFQNITQDTDTIKQSQKEEITRKLPGAVNIPDALIVPQ